MIVQQDDLSVKIQRPLLKVHSENLLLQMMIVRNPDPSCFARYSWQRECPLTSHIKDFLQFDALDLAGRAFRQFLHEVNSVR